MSNHKDALILNADYTAIGIITWQNAIKLDVCNIAKVVDFYEGDYITCTGNVKLPCPSVLALYEYQKRGNNIPFSRKNVFIRDRLRCQYCNKKLHYKQLTFDHVIPRSKAGKSPTHWGNIVSCCHPCNRKKSYFTLDECGMHLINKPVKPKASNFVLGLHPWSTIQKAWIPYIPPYYLELLKISED